MTRYIIVALCALLFSSLGWGQSAQDRRMVSLATPHFAGLTSAIETSWPTLSMRIAIPAQIEQESLWNQYAELCVPRPSCSRERGVGFGQFTVTPRFNIFNEAKRSDPRLRDWAWEDRFNPTKQFIAIVVKDRDLYKVCKPLMIDEWNGLACVMSSYNGGFGGFTADRRLCGNTTGCNPQKWTGHVATTSLKAKKALAGYGKSFFEINREYVDNVLVKRSAKYAGVFK